MMLLLDYLNNTSFSSDDEMRSHFMEQFGVNVKVENDLYLFKYGQLEAKWLEKITHECRGVILRKVAEGNWKVVSLPPFKFFNQHEGHCPVFNENNFNSLCYHMSFVEKCDGTACQIFNDNGTWRMSTLGTITPMQCGDSPWTFDKLFWNLVDKKYPLFREWLEWVSTTDDEITIFCELCTEENRILARYPEDRIYLLCIRNNNTGEYFKHLSLASEETGLHLPARMSFNSVGVKSLSEAKDFVERESKNIEKYGEYAEGMVLVDNNTNEPLCKMKNSLYVQLHHAVGAGDIKCTRNKVIEGFFCGNMDDLYPVLTPSMQEFADKLGDWWRDKIKSVMDLIAAMKDREFDSVKDFALHVKANIRGEFQPFFFMNKMEDNGRARLRPVDSESVSKWMRGAYKKFEAEMKALSGI